MQGNGLDKEWSTWNASCRMLQLVYSTRRENASLLTYAISVRQDYLCVYALFFCFHSQKPVCIGSVARRYGCRSSHFHAPHYDIRLREHWEFVEFQDELSNKLNSVKAVKTDMCIQQRSSDCWREYYTKNKSKRKSNNKIENTGWSKIGIYDSVDGRENPPLRIIWSLKKVNP